MLPAPVASRGMRVMMTVLTTCLTLSASVAQDLPLSDGFDDALDAWTVVDDTYFGAPARSGPGRWVVEDGILRQTSNIWIGDPPLEFEIYLGTHAVTGNDGWRDYSMNVDAYSSDNDGIGILFRYKDPLNYYRFLLMQDAMNGGPVSRIERRTNGVFETLAENRADPAIPSGWFTMTADIRGDSVSTYINGERMFALRDTAASAITGGKVGLSVYANSGAHFDNLLVSADPNVREAPTLPPPAARGPYLQRPSPSSMLIAWRSARAGVGAVEYGRTAALGQIEHESSTKIDHAIELTGLEPDTEYYYRTLNDNEPASSIVSFRTSKTRSDSTFAFLVIGDSGTGTRAQQDVAAYIEDKGILDFGIHVGDVHQGDGANYQSIYFDAYKHVINRMPMMLSVGNHDTYADNAATYLNDFYLPHNNPQNTERYYSFDYATAHLIALDSNIDFTPGSPQYEWLVDDLQSAAAQSATWTFVYFHHPPYCQAWSGWAGDLNVRQHLMPLFESYGVDVVFNGHTHAYERGSLHGVTYVISGGGGGGLDDYGRDVPHIAVTELAHHVTRVDVSGTTLRIRATTPESEIIDDYTITKASHTDVEAGGHVSALSAALEPIYPNPIGNRAVARIELTMFTSQSVAIEAFNALGQRVALIGDGFLTSGVHTFDLSTDGYATGNYFIRITTETQRLVRTLMVVD